MKNFFTFPAQNKAPISFKKFLAAIAICCFTFTNAQTTFTASTLQGDTVKSMVMLKTSDISATGIEASDTIRAHAAVVAEQNLQVNGNINLLGSLNLAPGLGLELTPISSGNNTPIVTLGFLNSGGPTTKPSACIVNTLTGWFTPGDGFGIFASKNKATLSLLVENNASVGNGYIDLAGTITGTPFNQGDLYINQKCLNNTRINIAGGTVFMGDQVRMNKHVEIGTSASVNDPANTSLDIFTNAGKGLNFNTYNNAMPLISIANTNFAYSPFIVLGAGQTGINNANPYKYLTVNGDVSFANYAPSAGNATDGFNGLEILGNNQIPTRRGITTDADPNGNFNFYLHSYQAPSAFNFKDGNGNKDLVKIYSNGQTEINAPNGNTKIFDIKDLSATTASQERITFYADGRAYFGTKRIQSSHIHANSDFQFWGKVACKELVVVDPTKWADFVFDSSYKLTPLSEVEAFYKTNHHLKDVPSESEVKENGINAAEMDATLLQKIEELTLYMVELNKKVNTLQKENQLLKEKK